MSLPTKLEDQIREDFIKGNSLSKLCSTYSLPRFQVAKILDHPTIEPHTRDRISTLRLRHAEFRLSAMEYAEDAIEVLKNLMDNSSNESIKRLTAKDLIEYSGMAPAKVIKVDATGTINLGQETRDWLDRVMLEVDGEDS